MGKTIKARFSKDVIEPMEKIDIAEGKEITITIIEIPSKKEEDAFEKSAGGWKGTGCPRMHLHGWRHTIY